jgi:hypothetical protein
LGWEIDSLSPYLYPTTHLRFLFITFLGELVFVLWLLIRGWKIQDPSRVLEPASVSNGQTSGKFAVLERWPEKTNYIRTLEGKLAPAKERS